MTPTSLLRNPLISSHAVRLWSVLASYTYGDQATDRPSRARLAADIGWRSTRSVDSHLAELQHAGYLTVRARWRPDGGKARNLYILEWEQLEQPDPASAGQPGPVDGPATTTPRPPTQNRAGDVPDDSAQERCSTHGNDTDSPPITEMPTKGNLRSQVPQPFQESDVSRASSSTSRNELTSKKDEREALLQLLRLELPDRLSGQITTSALRIRVEALVQADWTANDLTVVIAQRNWDGAGPGAVITWLKDLATSKPTRCTDRTADSRDQTLRLRADYAKARATAAPIDSPARRAAVELAAQLRRG